MKSVEIGDKVKIARTGETGLIVSIEHGIYEVKIFGKIPSTRLFIIEELMAADSEPGNAARTDGNAAASGALPHGHAAIEAENKAAATSSLEEVA